MGYEPEESIQCYRLIQTHLFAFRGLTKWLIVILNNYFGRQFNSLNDVAIHPESKDIYFTDTIYGYVQDFRPAPGLQDQVYRFNPDTGAVTVVADGFDHPNGRRSRIRTSLKKESATDIVAGFTFSPDGKYAYVADTGIDSGFFGLNFTRPASMYVLSFLTFPLLGLKLTTDCVLQLPI